MSDQSSGTKKSNNQAKAATSTLQTAATDRQADPLYEQIRSIIGSVVSNPTTLTPDVQESMYRQGVSQANAGAQSFLDEKMQKIQGYGSTGYRSGAARNAEYEAGARLGENLAMASRQTQIDVANRRVSDLIAAANAGQGFLSGDFNTSQAVANAQMGAANVMGQNAQIPSPTAQLLGGVGSLGGTLGSAAIGK